MIISFYPGAGGNKYYRHIRNLQWQTHNRGYDPEVNDQISEHRYLYDDSKFDQNLPVILTHCTNTPLIQKVWPTHPITVILADMQSCLRREWVLFGHDRYLDRLSLESPDLLEFYHAIRDPMWPDVIDKSDLEHLPSWIKLELETEYNKMISPTDPAQILRREYSNKIDSAYSQIDWHKNYYQLYPLDLSCADQIVNVEGDSEFAVHMKTELALYTSEVFDDCWRKCYE